MVLTEALLLISHLKFSLQFSGSLVSLAEVSNNKLPTVQNPVTSQLAWDGSACVRTWQPDLGSVLWLLLTCSSLPMQPDLSPHLPSPCPDNPNACGGW